MESSGRGRAPSPCSHHHHHTCFLSHHHHHHHHHCHLHSLAPFHHHHHCSRNQHVSPRLVHLPHFHNPVPVSHVPWPQASNLEHSVPAPGSDSGFVVFEEHERKELEEEDDEEPIFVLTDEWKEFFAKSEAKRKLEKKQAKKKGKT